MTKRDVGVTILILALLAILGGVGEHNYQRNLAAEDQKNARAYKGYSSEEVAALIGAYEQEIETLESRYDDAKGRGFETRSGGLIDERIREFERAQKVGGSTRSMGGIVAQKEGILRGLRREQSLRGRSGSALLVHLRRLVTI